MRNIFCHFGLTASKRYIGIYIYKYVSVYEPLELYRKRSIPCDLFHRHNDHSTRLSLVG